ncbi:arsenate reductase/protein-tyrosine-phosphatase family protein [Actinotalea solisilvae]|uniref:arsenate reductase/protein-tyrosine-phosphatase family protein n=1 Tax=Actinotalea solisilvae TaxID=2072922 RepID=UPI0018F162DA|nr:low molecular weight phosphatase family protein [Actinotalea solisilvae]
MTTDPHAPSSATFSVLTVCTGNICRSPAVERLLAAGLGSTVTVTSAGTRAMVGHPVSPPMVPLLTAAGVSSEGFVARQLTEQLVREADLVLPLTRAHRAAVVDLAPAAVRRTFTLLELARLAAAVDPADLPAGPPAARLRALLPLAAARRGHVPPGDDDVVDPYGRGDALYAESFGLIEPAVRAIVAVARG